MTSAIGTIHCYYRMMISITVNVMQGPTVMYLIYTCFSQWVYLFVHRPHLREGLLFHILDISIFRHISLTYSLTHTHSYLYKYKAEVESRFRSADVSTRCWAHYSFQQASWGRKHIFMLPATKPQTLRCQQVWPLLAASTILLQDLLYYCSINLITTVSALVLQHPRCRYSICLVTTVCIPLVTTSTVILQYQCCKSSTHFITLYFSLYNFNNKTSLLQ